MMYSRPKKGGYYSGTSVPYYKMVRLSREGLTECSVLYLVLCVDVLYRAVLCVVHCTVLYCTCTARHGTALYLCTKSDQSVRYVLKLETFGRSG